MINIDEMMKRPRRPQSRRAFYSDSGLSGVDSAIAKALKPNFLVDEILPIARSGDVEAIKRKVAEVLQPYDAARRVSMLAQAKRELKDREARIRGRRAILQGERDDLTLARDILDEIVEWDEANPRLQRAVDSRAHDLARALSAGHVYGIPFHDKDKLDADESPLVRYDQMTSEQGEIFVVEHDWAAAFDGSQDYEGAEFRLPYERCSFEFCYGGRRVILRARQTADQTGPEIAAFLELRTAQRGAWICLTAPTEKMYDIALPAILQVKAICISLEAEITYTDAVRIPEKLRKARERDGKLPPFDHHIVRLHRRSRAQRYEGEPEPGPRKRLHFRRGHWRHYATHRTWIKWTLVGSPDLGFVDKEYRL